MKYQHENDTNKFVELFSEFTGISKKKLIDFLKDNTVHNLLNHPFSLQGITEKQREKIESLKILNKLCRNFEIFKEKYTLVSSDICGEYHVNLFKNKDKESFVLTLADSQNNVIKSITVQQGTINESPVYPREIVKLALMYDASQVFLAHNHPGGSLKPSNSDIEITKRISAALRTVNIPVTDHIIVSDDKFYSFAEHGLSHHFVSSVFEKPSAYKSVRDKISEAKKKAAKQDNAKNHNHKSIDKER